MKILFLLIFAIILCIYPSYTTAEIRTFAHVEEKDDYLPKSPRMQKLKVYDDGTAVARIVRLNTVELPKVCFYEIFSLRIIHLDGTVDEKEIDLEKLGIPPINYCFIVQPNALPILFLDFELIRKNQILISYVNTTNPNDYSTFEDWGMVIDFDGNEYSRIFFAPRFVDKTFQFAPGASNTLITLNVNREKGFLRIYNVRGGTIQEWQQYQIEPDGTITKLTSGIIPVYSDNLAGGQASLVGTTISTVDEGYAVLVGTTINNFTATEPLLPQGQLSVIPIGYNSTSINPIILYQTSSQNLKFANLKCGIAFAGVGQTCVLSVFQSDIDGIPPVEPDKSFIVKVDFLSSGSTTGVEVISNNNIAPTQGFVGWDVESLHFGGFLLTSTVNPPNPDPKRPNKIIYGYLYSGANENPIEWEFPEPVPGNTEGIIAVLPHNNTLLVPQFEDGNIWSVMAIDLPKFAGERDMGYNNLNVQATNPAINASVNPKTLELSIDFYNPVDLSNGKLSIYQVVDKQQSLLKPLSQSNLIYKVVDDKIFILRQSVPGEECLIKNDGKTVSTRIIESTFSVSEGNYFVTVDNEFVRNTEFNEPMLGIRENVWNFINERKEDTFAPKTTGLLRLNDIGTKVFDNLSQEEQDKFYDTIVGELSFTVPLERPRLSINKRVQVDKGSKDKRYLISVGIEQTRETNENSVATIIELINTMIINKNQSPIGVGQVTAYFDETYGFIQSPNLWEAYKNRLIGLFVVIGLFAVLFIFAQVRSSREKERAIKERTKIIDSRNMAIFQLGLILFDLMVDILFVSTNAQDVSVLYIPSVVFVTLPIAINTILAFYVISQENTEPKFYKWFSIHGGIASIFILLAGADIEALDILQSNLAGLEYFQAPFSKPARSKIFWGAFLNIFTEDIPQVIIQIYYRTHSVTYDIVPLLTLISSSVNLTVNIIGRLYQATNRLRNKNIKNYNTPGNDTDDYDFGALADKSDIGRGVKSDIGRGDKSDIDKGDIDKSDIEKGDIDKSEKEQKVENQSEIKG